MGNPGQFAAPDERAEISRGHLGGQGQPGGRRGQRKSRRGLRDEFVKALAPPKEPEPIPHTRGRALKPYNVIFRSGRYGPKAYSGAVGSANDIPSVLVARLRGRVEVVLPTTEVCGIPLQVWMETDD